MEIEASEIVAKLLRLYEVATEPSWKVFHDGSVAATQGPERSRSSVAVGADDLAVRYGSQRPVGPHVDRALEEVDAPVDEEEVAAAGCMLVALANTELPSP